MIRVIVLVGCLLVLPFLSIVGWIFLEASSFSAPVMVYIASAQLVSLITLAVLWEMVSPNSKVRHSYDHEMKELLASRSQYKALYKNSPVPYITIDSDGTITQYNLAATRLFDTTRTNLIGQNLYSFFIEDEEGSTGVVLGKLKVKFTISDQQIPIQTVRNEPKWVMLSVFTNDNSNLRLVSMVDITEQKKVDVAKSEFVALATHQLRTPIAAVRWNVELLERSIKKNKAERYPDYLEKINRNVARMIALINDFLSVSKLETGTFATQEEDINLTEYFASIREEFTQPITEKQLSLNIIGNPENFIFKTDSRLFHIITSNLLSNAVKYTPSNARVDWSYQVEDDKLIMTISDTGIGIPAEEQAELFKKFFRASNAQRHQTEGTGLGLYVVKQSAEQLGGTIEIQSEEDVGTTFIVKLPIRN